MGRGNQQEKNERKKQKMFETMTTENFPKLVRVIKLKTRKSNNTKQNKLKKKKKTYIQAYLIQFAKNKKRKF